MMGDIIMAYTVPAGVESTRQDEFPSGSIRIEFSTNEEQIIFGLHVEREDHRGRHPVFEGNAQISRDGSGPGPYLLVASGVRKIFITNGTSPVNVVVKYN
jgi:hypothetical protein